MSEKSKIICHDEMSGSISIKAEDGIRLRLNLTLARPLPETDVIKLNLYSSLYPKLPKLNGGTAEMSGSDFRMTKNIVDCAPYSAEDIDTVEIIRKNVFTEESMTLTEICFASPEEKKPSPEIAIAESTEDSDSPDLDEIKQKLSYLQENPAYRSYLSLADDLKSPIENAAEALDNLHRTLSYGHEEGANKMHMESIRQTMHKYKRVNLYMPEDFQWYKVNSLSPPARISAFPHILYTPAVIHNFTVYGHYLLGIKNDADIVCIAIPVAEDDPNPMPHVDDCCVYIRPKRLNYEYCTVCVALEPDGQYFMPIC